MKNVFDNRVAEKFIYAVDRLTTLCYIYDFENLEALQCVNGKVKKCGQTTLVEEVDLIEYAAAWLMRELAADLVRDRLDGKMSVIPGEMRTISVLL